MQEFRYLLFVILAIGLQISPLAADEAKENSHAWKGDATMSLSLARGNTQATNFSFAFSARKSLAQKLEWINKGTFLLGKTDDQTFAEALEAGTRIDWKHSKSFFIYGEVVGIRDKFKDFDSRFLPSVGIGFKIWSEENHSLSIDAGISGVFTRYGRSDLTDSYLGLTVGNKLILALSSRAELTQKLVVNAAANELRRYFASFEMNLATSLTKGLALKLTLIDNYDHRPFSPGIKKNDFIFLTGLSTKF